jgi:hypothetical protein
MSANLEIIVERQLGGIGRAGDQRSLSQKPMLTAVNAQHSVPAVDGLSNFAGQQIGQASRIRVGGSGGANNRNNGGQDFRSPEDRLILRRDRGTSRPDQKSGLDIMETATGSEGAICGCTALVGFPRYGLAPGQRGGAPRHKDRSG